MYLVESVKSKSKVTKLTVIPSLSGGFLWYIIEHLVTQTLLISPLNKDTFMLFYVLFNFWTTTSPLVWHGLVPFVYRHQCL